jgi:hypothetical protein
MKRNSLSMVIASSLALSATLPSFALANGDQANRPSTQDSRAQAGVTESERLALQLIIASAMVDQKGGDLAKIDRDVAKKYQTMRNVYFGSIPTSLVGGAFSAYVGPQGLKASATVTGPLLMSLKPVLLTIWEGAKMSGRVVDTLFTALKIDKAFDSSSTASEKIYKLAIKPILILLVNAHTATVSGSSLSGASLYTSYKFYTNDAQDAMSYEQLRALLGQNEAIRSRIDSIVTGVAPIMNLGADSQAKLKILIYDDILKQAIANNFTDDSSKYDLDVIKLMIDGGLVDSSMTLAVQKVRQVASAIQSESQRKVSANDVIVQNVDIALNLAAVIETNINSGKIQDKKTVAELQRMLGALTARLALIGFNFQK